jgi:hypothetical protein
MYSTDTGNLGPSEIMVCFNSIQELTLLGF